LFKKYLFIYKKMELLFRKSECKSYSAYAVGDFSVSYPHDAWLGILRHLADERHRDMAFDAQRLQKELFPQLPLIICQRMCETMVRSGFAERFASHQPTQNNMQYVLTPKGRDDAKKNLAFHELGEDKQLSISWCKIGSEIHLMDVYIQDKDPKSQVIAHDDEDRLLELFRTPREARNGSHCIVKCEHSLELTAKDKNGCQSQIAPGELVIGHKQTRLKPGKNRDRDMVLKSFPNLEELMEQSQTELKRAGFQYHDGKLKAEVAEGEGEFHFFIPIGKLSLRFVNYLKEHGFEPANGCGFDVVPADKLSAQNALRNTLVARLSAVGRNRKRRYPEIAADVSNKFKAAGYNIAVPEYEELLPHLPPENPYSFDLTGL
jgi:hypothetical protein